jgi:hypothetical protein
MSSGEIDIPTVNRATSSLAGGVWPAELEEETKEYNLPLGEYFASTSPKRRVTASRPDRLGGSHEGRADYSVPLSSRMGPTRSLVGGSFALSPADDDTSSLSSTSLMGAGYTEGDQSSVVTKQSLMDYSEDDRSTDQGSWGAASNHSNMRGDILTVPPSRSQYLLERELDSESLYSEQSSISGDGDAYFKLHPAVPLSLLGAQIDDVDESLLATDDDTDHSDPRVRDVFGAANLLELVSSDTEIYEDFGDDSSSGFDPLFEDNNSSDDEGSWKVQVTNSPAKSVQESKDNFYQSRGRDVAQMLLSQARKGEGGHDAVRTLPNTPTTEASASSPSPEPQKANAIQSFLKHPFLRRKQRRLTDKDYFVVDARLPLQQTISPIRRRSTSGESFDDSELSSEELSSERSTHSATSESLYDSADEGDVMNFFEETKEKLEPFFDVLTEATPILPDGFVSRASSEDIISELGLGSQGLKAVQKLRKMMQEAENGGAADIPTFTIDGIEVKNYQGHVQRSIATYRWEILKVSDEDYTNMLKEDNAIVRQQTAQLAET